MECMTDVINQRYGITDDAIEREVARLLPVMAAWGAEDAKAHPSVPLSDADLAQRRQRLFQAKASSVLEGLGPTVESEARFEVELRLRWDGEKTIRYIKHAARSGTL